MCRDCTRLTETSRPAFCDPRLLLINSGTGTFSGRGKNEDMAPLPPRAPLGNATTRRSSNAATSNERSADQLKMITKDTLPPAKGNKRNNKAKKSDHQCKQRHCKHQ